MKRVRHVAYAAFACALMWVPSALAQEPTGRVYGGEKLETVINNYVAQGWHFISASGVGDSSGFAVMRRERN